MSNQLGGAFLRCAMGPLNYAGGCIISGKVADGLRELTADNLHGGFKRGVAEAAQHVGVGPAEIERLLPMADIVVAAARLHAAQADAVSAWSVYAGQMGGLLAGAGDLTVDGRAPDVSAFLERLSKRTVRDPPLSEPLHALALAIGRWADLVEQSGELLAGGDVLARAYRMRRIRRAAPLVVLLLVAAAVVPFVVARRAVRGRVEATLGASDPCTALTIAAADLERASDEQRARAALRRTECDDTRKREADAITAEKTRQEKAREAEQTRRDREAKCTALADHLSAGDIQPDDASIAQGKEALLVRIAKGTLVPADMVETELPCADTPAGAKMGAAFATAVLKSPNAWTNADDVSDRVAGILIGHASELATVHRYKLLARADVLVKRALVQKTSESSDRAARVCKLKDDLEIRGAHYCPALATLRAAGKL